MECDDGGDDDGGEHGDARAHRDSVVDAAGSIWEEELAHESSCTRSSCDSREASSRSRCCGSCVGGNCDGRLAEAVAVPFEQTRVLTGECGEELVEVGGTEVSCCGWEWEEN